jgi:hypothetical protein
MAKLQFFVSEEAMNDRLYRAPHRPGRYRPKATRPNRAQLRAALQDEAFTLRRIYLASRPTAPAAP